MTAVLERTANEIIRSALRAAGIIRPDEVPAAEDSSTGLEILNNLLKRWQAQGNHLWSQTEGVVFMDVGKESYFVGPSGDEATTQDDLITTTTTADLAALATTIAVTDTTGMLGALNLITIDPISTQFWTDGNSGVTTVVSGELVLTNGAATAGFSDFTLTCVPGDVYIVRGGYKKGTSVSGVLSIIDPTDSSVLATSTVPTTQTVSLEFTATQTSMTFRLANTSAVSGETSLLTSLTQINKGDGDTIGIKQDDNTRHWTNIVEVLSSTSLEINVGMVSAATSGVQVFTFSTIIDRPLRIYNERTETIGNDNEIPAFKWSRQEYMQQPTKSSQGTVIKMYYSPQLTNGRLYVWQTAQNCNQVANFTFDRPLQVAEEQSDNPEIPSEWFDALKWNIAREMIAEYGVTAGRAQIIVATAAESLEEALDFDEQNDFVSVQPDLSSMGG